MSCHQWSRPSTHCHLAAGAPDDQHVADARGLLDGLIHGRLERGGRTPAVAPVGGDDQDGLGVVDARAQRLGGEPAEHHRVHGPDAGTGQHRDHGLGDHRQVDRHAVTGRHPELGQRVGRAGHLRGEFGIGQRAGVPGLTLEVDRDPLPETGGHMTVHAVLRDVQPPADEPLRERRIRPVQGDVPGLRPVQPPRLLLPERDPVGAGLLGQGRGRVGRGGEVRVRREGAILVQQVLQRLVAHARPPRAVGSARLSGGAHPAQQTMPRPHGRPSDGPRCPSSLGTDPRAVLEHLAEWAHHG